MLRRFTQFSPAPAVISSRVAAAASTFIQRCFTSRVGNVTSHNCRNNNMNNSNNNHNIASCTWVASSSLSAVPTRMATMAGIVPVHVASQRHSSTSAKRDPSPEERVVRELQSFLVDSEEPRLGANDVARCAQKLTDASAKLNAARHVNDLEALVSELLAAVMQVGPAVKKQHFDFKRGSEHNPSTLSCAHLFALLRAIHVADRHVTNVASHLENFVVKDETRPDLDLRPCARTLIAETDALKLFRLREDGGKALVRHLASSFDDAPTSFDFTRGSNAAPTEQCKHLDSLLGAIFTIPESSVLITDRLKEVAKEVGNWEELRVVVLQDECSALNKRAVPSKFVVTTQSMQLARAVKDHANNKIIFVGGDSGSGKTLAAVKAPDSVPPIYFSYASKIFGDAVYQQKQTLVVYGQPLRDAIVARCIARAVFARVQPPTDVAQALPTPDVPESWKHSPPSCAAVVAAAAEEFNINATFADCRDPNVRIAVVIDEISSLTNEMRGICSIGYDLEVELARHFKLLGENSRVRLIIVGTGVEGWRANLGSSIDKYQVISMTPTLVPWSQRFLAQRMSRSDVDDFFFNRSATNFAMDKTDALAKSCVANLPSAVADMLGNLRFAALLFEQVVELDGRLSKRVAEIPSLPRSFFDSELATCCSRAMAAFVGKNGLATAKAPLSVARMALEVVMNPKRVVHDETWRKLSCTFGLLRDTAIEVVPSTDKARLDSGDLRYVPSMIVDNNTDNNSSNGQVETKKIKLCRPRGQTRYAMTPASIQMLLHGFGCSTAGRIGDSRWAHFEQASFDFAFLCTAMPDFSEADIAENEADDCVSKLRRFALNYFGINPHQAQVSRMFRPPMQIGPTELLLGKEHTTRATTAASLPSNTKALFAVINDAVTGKSGPSVVDSDGQPILPTPGAVTIMNLPRSSYADIIVCSPNKLVLIQCKRMERGITVDRPFIESEFVKMGSPGSFEHTRDKRSENKALTKLLLEECCGPNAKTVEFVYLFESVRTVEKEAAAAAAAAAATESATKSSKSASTTPATPAAAAPKSKKRVEGALPQGLVDGDGRYLTATRVVHSHVEDGIAYRHWVFDVTSSNHGEKVDTLYPVVQGDMRTSQKHNVELMPISFDSRDVEVK